MAGSVTRGIENTLEKILLAIIYLVDMVFSQKKQIIIKVKVLNKFLTNQQILYILYVVNR
jgi:hypothetical protein